MKIVATRTRKPTVQVPKRKPSVKPRPVPKPMSSTDMRRRMGYL